MPKPRFPTYEEFYSRQMIMSELGKKGQRKLAKSSVAVVGLGGLGTISSLYLSLAGVGHLRLIDQDTVEIRNLHRQVLYSLENLDYPKVEASADRLRRSNPLVQVESVPENLNPSNAERLLSGVDCVVDGLDNMKTRYLVNRVCAKLRVPYIFGAAIGVEGNISVFSPPETPCLECVLPNIRDTDLLTCDVRGVLGATVGTIGSMQALEAVKVLAGTGSPLKGKLLICDFSDMYFTIVDVAKRSQCPACEGSIPETGKDKGQRLVWLCGETTVNVNPEKKMKLQLDQAYELLKKKVKIRVKSQFAVIFDYEKFEISLFNSGRMLIKNVKDEKSALKVYDDVLEKLLAG